jgi:hypothetical protein
VGAGVGVGVQGSYNSALARSLPPLLSPPATSTIPLGSSVAVWNRRAVLRLPVAAQVPLAGSYSSALARMPPIGPNPPATSTIPLGSKLAVCCSRPVLRLPVGIQVPLAGL